MLINSQMKIPSITNKRSNINNKNNDSILQKDARSINNLSSSNPINKTIAELPSLGDRNKLEITSKYFVKPIKMICATPKVQQIKLIKFNLNEKIPSPDKTDLSRNFPPGKNFFNIHNVSHKIQKMEISKSSILFNNSVLLDSISTFNELKIPEANLKESNESKKKTVFSKLNGNLIAESNIPHVDKSILSKRTDVNFQELNYESSQRNGFKYRREPKKETNDQTQRKIKERTVEKSLKREEFLSKFLFLELNRHKNKYYKTKFAIRMLV